MKKGFLVLMTLFSFILTSCYSDDDYEKVEVIGAAKEVILTVKDINGRIMPGTPIYVFAETNWSINSDNFEKADYKLTTDKSGIAIVDNIFSKIGADENKNTNDYRFIVTYTLDGVEKQKEEKILIKSDYLSFSHMIICD